MTALGRHSLGPVKMWLEHDRGAEEVRKLEILLSWVRGIFES